MNIGDRICLGGKAQMINSFIPVEYAHKFATIVEIRDGNSIRCKIDDDGNSWYVRTGNFTLIDTQITMPEKEDLFKFLNG